MIKKQLVIWLIFIILIGTAVLGFQADRIVGGDLVTITIDYADNMGGILTENIIGAVPLQISNNGIFSQEDGKIKWFFLDNSVTQISYAYEGDGEVSGVFTSGESLEQVPVNGDFILGKGLPQLKSEYDLQLQVKTLQETYEINEDVILTDPPDKPSVLQRIVSWFRGLIGLATGVVQEEVPLTPEEDQSKFVNFDENLEIYLTIGVEKYIEATDKWEEEIVVMQDEFPRTMENGDILKLDILWNEAGGWISDSSGLYRIKVEAKNVLFETIKNLNGEELIVYHEFEIAKKTDLLPPPPPVAGEEDATDSGEIPQQPDAPIAEEPIEFDNTLDIPEEPISPGDEEPTESPTEEVIDIPDAPSLPGEQEEPDLDLPTAPPSPGEQEEETDIDLPTAPPSPGSETEQPTQEETELDLPTAPSTPGQEVTDPIDDTELNFPDAPPAPGEEESEEISPDLDLPTAPSTPGGEETDPIDTSLDLPSPPSAPGEEVEEPDEPIDDLPDFDLPSPPSTPGEDTSDTEEPDLDLPSPPKVPGEETDTPSEGTPDFDLPSPPSLPGEEVEEPTPEDPTGCCVFSSNNQRSCHRTLAENCAEKKGAFKNRACQEEDKCIQEFECLEGEIRICESFGFEGFQLCNDYNTYGRCIFDEENTIRQFDNDLDNDPDATDCAPQDEKRSHLSPEVCEDGLDNNCNFMVDEEGCITLAQAASQGLVGFAFRGSLETGALWRSASIIVIILIGLMVCFTIYKDRKKKKN